MKTEPNQSPEPTAPSGRGSSVTLGKEMYPPTKEDWNSEPWGIDTPEAYLHFFGKTHQEAIAMFEDNALLYQEDIEFMPCVCFGFYVRAYAEYILSLKSVGDCDAASCFIGRINRGLLECRGSVVENRELLERALLRVAEGQVFFGAKEDIYGSFRERVDETLEKFRK
jgi:hypothetical protein